jgi:hypothetical protein
LESGEHYEVNGTAFKVLEALEGGTDLETIVFALADEYGTCEDTVRADVEPLPETCETEGLVTREA